MPEDVPVGDDGRAEGLWSGGSGRRVTVICLGLLFDVRIRVFLSGHTTRSLSLRDTFEKAGRLGGEVDAGTRFLAAGGETVVVVAQDMASRE